MSFFFAWEPNPVPFNPLLHARCDMDILALALHHEEGKYASLKLQIPKQTPLPFPAWGLLSARLWGGEIVLLFQGDRQESPQSSGEAFEEIELIACPKDADIQLQNILQEHQTSDDFEPLLFSETDSTNPHLIRLSKPVHFFWDPRTLQIRLSSLFEGARTLDVTPWAIRESLSFQWGKHPLSQVNLTLQAQWIQRTQGIMNLTSAVSHLFSEKSINTLTGGAFKNFWPRTGQRLGQSGYWILSSRLREIPPPSLEAGRSKPLSRPTPQGNSQKAFIKRTWFKGKLLVGWRFHQKRIERLSFILHHAFQKSVPLPANETSATLTLHLQPLCPETSIDLWTPYTFYEAGHRLQEDGQIYHCIAPHRSSSSFLKDAAFWQAHGPLPGALPNPAASSFFLTERGKKVAASALKIASTLLAQRARSFCFCVSIPFEAAPVISPEDAISLSDPRLPGGQVRGKIVSSCLTVCGETGEALITLKAQASLGIPQGSSENPSFLPYDDQGPQDPYAALDLLRYTPLLQKVALINGPEEQQKYLEDGATSLRAYPTRLFMQFKKLSSCEALTHQIHVSLSYPWSSPPQITLQGEPHV